MDPLLTPVEFAAATNGKIREDDPRVAPLLAGASQAIRRYCGWHIGPVVSEPLTLDGPGGDVLVLPTLRLVNVESLTVLGESVEVADLEWSANGEVRRACWPTRWRSVVIGISHGFDDYADVKQVLQQVVGNAISSPLGATSEQAGQLAVSWSTTAPGVSGGLSLLDRDLAVLNMYRLPGGA